MICLDSSVLIDYFRKTNKTNSLLFKLQEEYTGFAVSIITEYEIYVGSKPNQMSFWDNLFQGITVLPFDEKACMNALEIHKDLKSRNQLIEIPDLFIAATAQSHNLPLATINKKHFERIKNLNIVVP